MAYGVPAIATVSTASNMSGGAVRAMIPNLPQSGRLGATAMSPMETVMETFFEIRDGINQLVALAVQEKKDMVLGNRNAQIKSGDTDTQTPIAGTGDSPNMLASLKKALRGLSTSGKSLLGIVALIGVMILWNTISETLIKILTPVLEFLGETIIPALQELNELILSHPDGYWTLLGATGLVVTLNEVFGITGSLNKLFTLISNFARTAFIDDVDFRTKAGKGWAGKINRALYGTKSGTGGLFSKLSRSFTSLGSSIRGTFFPDEFAKNLKAIAAGWKVSITGSFFGKSGPRGVGGGMISKITSSVSRIATAIKGIFGGSSVLKIFDSIKLAGTNFAASMTKITKSITKTLGFISKISGLSQFLKLGFGLVKAVPILGQIVMVIQGIFGFVKGAIEGWETGGPWGAIKGGLIGLYDALIGNFLNLIFDIVGWILKKFGLEGLGDFFSNLDFSFETIKETVLNVVDTIRWVFHKVVNGLKKMANGVMAGLNWLPGIEMEQYHIEAFEPRKKTTEDVMRLRSIEFSSEPPLDTRAIKALDELVRLEDLKSKRIITKPLDVETLSKIDYSNLDMPAGPVFAPTTMTGGDVYNQSTYQTSGNLASTHSDETAKILSELTYK